MERTEPKHIRATYNEIHNLVKASAQSIAEWEPNMLIAIGGGGFFPARVLRTFLKDASTQRNISIHAIGLSLYESLPGTTSDQIGKEIIKTQWLDLETRKTLLGRRVLIVDEIDATRTTLHYALTELQNDVELELSSLNLPPGSEEVNRLRTKFAVFVVHNKLKPKSCVLPSDVPYFAAAEVGDVWFDYPWTAVDIEEHDRLAAAENAKAQAQAQASAGGSSSSLKVEK